MKEKKEVQEKITLSVSQEDKANLERLAQEVGCTRGGSPNISGLIRAIASGELEIKKKENPRPETENSQDNAIIKELVQEILKKLESKPRPETKDEGWGK